MKEKKMTLYDYFMALTLLGILIVITMQVVWRYVFNNSLSWTEELGRYIYAWTIFIGSAIALHEETHIRVDMLYNFFRGVSKRVLDIALYLLLIACQGYLLYYGVQYVLATNGTYSTALHLPMNIAVNTTLPISCIIGIIVTSKKLFKTVSKKEGEVS